MATAEKIISANNLVPLSVANTMLYIGSHMKNEDCDFDLRKYFVVVGSLGLSLTVFSVLGKFLIGEIGRDAGHDEKTRCEKTILYIIKYFNSLMRFTQVAMLIAGALIVLSNLSRVVFEAPEAHDDAGSVYCKRVKT